MTPEKKLVRPKAGSSRSRFKVAIVEDDENVRKFLLRVFTGTSNLSIVAACPDGETALRQLPQCSPDIALMDIDLPGISGIECVQILKAVLPAIRVMMLTAYDDDDKIFRSLLAGADGYILKPSTPRELLAGVRGALAGGSPMSPPVARRMINYFQQTKLATAKGAASTALAPEISSLTARETEVLRALAEGVSVKEISANLQISWETVRNHITNIYEKLHVHSRTEAVLKYLGRTPAAPA